MSPSAPVATNWPHHANITPKPREKPRQVKKCLPKSRCLPDETYYQRRGNWGSGPWGSSPPPPHSTQLDSEAGWVTPLLPFFARWNRRHRRPVRCSETACDTGCFIMTQNKSIFYCQIAVHFTFMWIMGHFYLSFFPYWSSFALRWPVQSLTACRHSIASKAPPPASMQAGALSRILQF